jgi:hypothetical protein
LTRRPPTHSKVIECGAELPGTVVDQRLAAD